MLHLNFDVNIIYSILFESVNIIYLILDADVDHDHYWVIGFAKGTMNLFVENILKIPELTTKNATQQLIADIGNLIYLSTFLKEALINWSYRLSLPRFIFN